MCRVYESKSRRYIRLCAHYGDKKGWQIDTVLRGEEFAVAFYHQGTGDDPQKHVRPEAIWRAHPPFQHSKEGTDHA